MSIRSIVEIKALQDLVSEWRGAGLRVGFVPTMGALHDGHLSLVTQAKTLADRVVVSIFVNPMQFGPQEDFSKYPRTLAADLDLLQKNGCTDAVFLPNAADIYPDGFATKIVNTDMATMLDGKSRPGHFDGVLTVVHKLFNIVRPDVALFGQKDYQQWRLIERMARDLLLPIEIVGCDIVRESDGLAMSSRNRFLSESERSLARQIFTAMTLGKKAFAASGGDHKKAGDACYDELRKNPAFVVDYVEVRDEVTLKPIVDLLVKSAVILVAVRIGSTRLIDNMQITTPTVVGVLS